jgi:uncharacterized membrane protein YfcA
MSLTLASAAYGLTLLAAGIACGLINALASSGSAVSLPILMMLGLPPLAANATNRLSVLFGSLMALRTFEAEGKVDWRAALQMVLPATAGSVLGVWLAKTLPAHDMALAITGAVLVALLLLFSKLKKALAKDLHVPAQVTFKSQLAMALVGVWLGFIVLDGATYLLLVVILLCRFDLPHANALKVFLLVTTTLVPIMLFWRAGDIWWTEGALLSLGSILGGHVGAKLSSFAHARLWVFRIPVVVIGLELVHLGIDYLAPGLERAI